MRKISIESFKDNRLKADTLMPCIPGPACERPYGFVGAGLVLSPLSVKLSFEKTVRHELIVLAQFKECDETPFAVSVLMNPSTEEKRLLWNTTSKPTVDAVEFLVNHPRMIPVSLNRGYKLQPVPIEKPWGREVWYTGIEERGVSQVEISNHQYVDLPILLSALGTSGVSSPGMSPILLKILEPSPDPKTGSLYFELHEKKEEVYIVSDVNVNAWPSCVGKMKYGVSQEQRSRFASDDEFKEVFKSLCLEYENCRKDIDNYLESVASQGLKSATIPSKASREDAVPREWREKEAKLESEINRYVGWLDLRQGDVVKVQRRVPHSLQYGITVVEFQTPVYERLIVTFNQKVLTQSHWDVSKAFEIMEINQPLAQNLLCLEDTDQIIIEQVVNFQDFEVLRMTQRVGTYKLDLAKFGHSIIFALKNKITVIGDEVVTLASGEACFIPAACSSILLESQSEDAIWLLGREKLI
jgi:hypothetical protein